ncbi:MAG TPA: acetyl-coenzyme A synthetase N-terminal domain-containing protein, partial [Nitrososphaerales archaeon]|nr:acetyl-coenzyme A synthetase N-terminal domain-containing protein [Nitrososphaerales archaeon]
MPHGRLLWQPDSNFVRRTNMHAYMKWLGSRAQAFESYDELWNWSVDDLEGFWGSVWKYFELAEADYPVLTERKMPGARWFEGSELNFAERVFKRRRDGPAVIAKAEKKADRTLTWQELEKKVGAFASSL